MECLIPVHSFHTLDNVHCNESDVLYLGIDHRCLVKVWSVDTQLTFPSGYGVLASILEV